MRIYFSGRDTLLDIIAPMNYYDNSSEMFDRSKTWRQTRFYSLKNNCMEREFNKSKSKFSWQAKLINLEQCFITN